MGVKPVSTRLCWQINGFLFYFFFLSLERLEQENQELTRLCAPFFFFFKLQCMCAAVVIVVHLFY